ncbi:MAG: response regulator [Deltaproteobacteria bacterium]|nr:response regulator [Deltaproteobacteria bacterium]
MTVKISLSSLKIGPRLILGFSLVVILTIAVGGLAMIEIYSIAGLTGKMYRHPLMVGRAIRDIRANIILMDELIRGLVEHPDQKHIIETAIKLNRRDQETREYFDIVLERFLGEKRIAQEAFQLFLDWRPIRGEVIQLMREGKSEAAAELVKDKGIKVVDDMLKKVRYVREFANSKAEAFFAEAEMVKQRTMIFMLLVIISTFLAGALIALLITRSITIPLKKIVATMLSMAEGDLKKEVDIHSRDEIGELADSFREMQSNLQEKANIAEKIAAGNFTQMVEVRNLHDLVALSLNQIVINFREVVKQSEAVAAGDFRGIVDPRSEEDELGRALRKKTDTLREVSDIALSISRGDYSRSIKIKGPNDQLGRALNEMTQALRDTIAENARQNWIKTGQNELNEKMSGEQDIYTLGKTIVSFFARYLNAQIGTIYFVNDDHRLELVGSYAFSKRKSLANVFELGQGLVGQAALERQIISVTNVPDDYIRINSSFGNTLPRNIVVVPFIYDDQVKGVLELGSVAEFSDQVMDFFSVVSGTLAVAFNTAASRQKLEELLAETSRQAEELQMQQEQLAASNEELEEQTMALKMSEQQLKQQQEELQVVNEELEEKNNYLEEQKSQIQQKNLDLEIIGQDLEKKAKELEITGKYKSEFLANMSHELRTPLNSLLILARNLSDNKKQNLTPDQVEAARIIYKSGADLLSLINEILDLSKIEAGKMIINVGEVILTEVADNLKLNFKHVFEEKGLILNLNLDAGLPATIKTDQQRLEQILKNLVANAVKFTHQGSVTVDFSLPRAESDLSTSGLRAAKAVAIAVTDTGVGIPQAKQIEIFQAFQQVDGGTSRKYGGTGLGLSISKELARLLGGELQLHSQVGAGSTFTLFLPLEATGRCDRQTVRPVGSELVLSSEEVESARTTPPGDIQPAGSGRSPQRLEVEPISDDRNNISKDDRCILIIEDDPNFARILRDQCHEKGFKALVSATGEGGLRLAEKHIPEAVVLDLNLPGISGLEVLDFLKANPKIRHIPVHIISAAETSLDAFKRGAIGFLTKPVQQEQLEEAFGKIEEVLDKKIKDLLLVEDDEALRRAIVDLVGEEDVKITEAATGQEALTALRHAGFDCMVLDLGLPDMTGFELLNQLEKERHISLPPVIVYTGKELSREDEAELRRFADSIIIKGVKSEERLLDETALFLHRMVKTMPEKKQKMIINLHDRENIFSDKKILVVDDDMRNVFALARVLKDKGMNVIKAEDGKKALSLLNEHPDVDLVLMDIMMPVLDGYETTKKIREQARFTRLPIIALTAKAMKDDREKCIAAGASDYLSKPVDVDRLLSMMRVWLYK